MKTHKKIKGFKYLLNRLIYELLQFISFQIVKNPNYKGSFLKRLGVLSLLVRNTIANIVAVSPKFFIKITGGKK